MYRQYVPNPLREADSLTMAAYTRRVMSKLWERLPILVYALLRCELFGINWYHLLGLELLSVVRSAHRDFHKMFKMFQKKLNEMGDDMDAKVLMIQSTAEFERILEPLGRAEDAVKALTKELELFRKSEVGKAFSRASNLSNELVVQKKEASAAQKAASEKLKAANTAAEQNSAQLKATLIRAESTKDILAQEMDALQAEIQDLHDSISASELRAQRAEAETAALRAELDAFHEMYQGSSSHHHHNGRPDAIQDHEWQSRPAEYETRQRSTALCKKALERKGHNMQMLNISFDCTDLAMVTADNTLVFLGGSPGGLADDVANMKVHMINLESGVVMEDIACTGKAPAARRGHHAFFFRDPQAGPIIYICGGVSWTGSMRFNDMYCLNLTTRVWSEVVTSLPVGGSMSGSHNGPSMYLFGTSWETGESALCVLHSMQHAALHPPIKAEERYSPQPGMRSISPEGSRLSVGGEREQPPRPQSSASELSDWSRSLPAGLHHPGASSPEPPREENSEADGTFLTQPVDVPVAKGHATPASDALAIVAARSETGGGSGAPEQGSSVNKSVRGMIESEHSFGSAGQPYPQALLPPRGSNPPRVKHSRPGRQMLLTGTRPLSGNTNTSGAGTTGFSNDGRPSSQPAGSQALSLTQNQHIPASHIPGGTWVPPDDFRNWYQGSKAIAKMPTARPPSGPSRPDKRDFAGARFYGPNPYRMQWDSYNISPRSANPMQTPGGALGIDWNQGTSRTSILSQEDSIRSTSTTKNTIGYEAVDLVDPGHWDTWMSFQKSRTSRTGRKVTRDVMSARVSSVMSPQGSPGTGARNARTLSAKDKRIMRRPPGHPTQHTRATDLL